MQRPHLPAGVTFVSDASVSLDPIELAQGEISRSKDVVTSVSKDLDQYDRWLKDFVASEKRSRARHARRVKRQQARERRQLARQRLVRSGRRTALSVAVFVRSVFLSLRRLRSPLTLFRRSCSNSFRSGCLGYRPGLDPSRAQCSAQFRSAPHGSSPE
jgi:hypothetical protein